MGLGVAVRVVVLHVKSCKFGEREQPWVKGDLL